MNILGIGVSTEAESLTQESKEEVWVLGENGDLIRLEDDDDEDN